MRRLLTALGMLAFVAGLVAPALADPSPPQFPHPGPMPPFCSPPTSPGCSDED
jgi:hypothetical protein